MNNQRSIFCDCLYFSSNSLARNLTRMAEESFKRTGLAPSHAFALMAINREPGISPSIIAREMHMTPSTITRFLDKLESKELIKRHVDGKSTTLLSTNAGRELQRALESSWQDLLTKYNGILGQEASAGLSRVLYDASEMVK